MSVLVLLIVLFPLAGSVLLGLAGRRLPRRWVGIAGAGSVGLAALAAVAASLPLLFADAPEAVRVPLWTWIEVGGFEPAVALLLDPLGALMALVVTIVGFLIHVYSIEYMEEDEDFSRFFAFMNLFVASMAILVLASDLLLLYLGWEGVGLASYLLIGFWYRDAANGRAARKAFIVTRIGDALLAVGLFVLFTELGTLEIAGVLERVGELSPEAATAVALLVLGGAIGKSAQVPLQTWLPDAMAGPTPVSALIHAATMVTAGVYLIARLHGLFLAAPVAMTVTAVIGAASLLIGAASALVQRDIKRTLAYSTMSQIGYMFLALGVGAWSAGMFHFMTHAFFKALLFLGAGSVILALHHEQDIFAMGGLRRKLPLTFWTFLIGAASLAALPFITAGFFSKDLILWEAWSSPRGGGALWAAGIAGALLTALYSFRLVFLVFFGEAEHAIAHRPGALIAVPLVVLAVLSLVGGFVELPHNLADVTLVSGFLAGTFAEGEAAVPEAVEGSELALQLVASGATLLGVVVAALLFLRRQAERAPARGPLVRFLLSGCGFDRLYDAAIVRPFCALARAGRGDLFDGIYRGIAAAAESAYALLSETQTGKLRWYVMGVAAGAAALAAFVVLA